ncbi:Small G protein signaling modulator 3, partial [Fasciola gigantica]
GPVQQPFLESVANRRAWLTCLEFSHTHTLGVSSLDDYDQQYAQPGSTVDEDEDQLWSRVHHRLVPSPRLTSLVRGQASDVNALCKPGEQLGIPHSLRPHIWPRLTGSRQKAREARGRDPPVTYTELDLLRTLPNNVCFSSSNSTGISRLRRVLRALAWLYVDVGYCQGMGLIAANLLLCMEEESAFWMMCSIVEDLLPPSYYSSLSLLGVQADQAVLCHLLPLYLPRLDKLLTDHEIELPLITLQWFLTLYSSVCSTAVTLRIWDLFFYDGSVVLFRIALALLSLKEPELLSLNTPVQISKLFPTLRSISDKMLPAFGDSPAKSPKALHVGVCMHRDEIPRTFGTRWALERLIVPLVLFPKYLAKRQLKRPRSRFSTLLHSVLWSTAPQRRITGMSVPFRTVLGKQSAETIDDDDVQADLGFTDDPKLKNVRQTEILMDLKQSIAQVVRHFRQTDPQHADATAQADYSMESHGLDLETYVQVAQHRRRRAKALLDFVRHEPDELGFRKNDIITVVNSEDEHCWVGELNGSRGWFPAKFVELLDERGKNYSPAGDDGVDQRIVQLIRGHFCNALGAVFTHGLKRPRLLGESGCHPWHFIVEAAAKEVERDFNSVYSRLVLCKTFRLDEEGKVLSPEEVLYRAIHTINMSHDLVSAHMDVKFRSLVCYGLNEQLLHMWLETLCSSVKVIEKWYHPWSYLRSPGWVQIKCELRVLSQFAFHLSPNYELDLGGASLMLLNPKDHAGSNRPRRRKSNLIGTVASTALSDVNHIKPLRRLTRAASTADPMNDPPSLARSFPAAANPVTVIQSNE